MNPYAHLWPKPRVLSTAVPLTVENLSDPLAPETLTPNHLLTLKTQVVLPPPGKFESPDQYSRKRWRRIQYIANQLWLRWQKEYCALLQKRQKWTTPKRSMKEGDVVLVCDNESPRNQWPLAVVTKVLPSSDQLVRKVQIMTSRDGEKKVYERPVNKLVLLLAKEDIANWTDLQWASFINSISLIPFHTKSTDFIFLYRFLKVFRLFGKWRTFREAV